MKTAIILLAFLVVGTLADGFGHNHRQGRRQGGPRRQQQAQRQSRNRSFRGRGGRQEDGGAVAPLGAYGAAPAPTAAPEVLPPPDYDYGAEAAPLGSYGSSSDVNGVASDDAFGAGAADYGDGGADYDAGGASAGAGAGAGAGDDNLAMLEKAVPGIPGEDYPIYAEVPETAFACDGQVDGGYYADPEAQCQVFHICTADGQGGLAKYSFLCPNGTVFNQNYFICDWWFNFDCAEAEGLYSLNDDIAAEREEVAAAAAASADDASASAPQASYGAAPDYGTAPDYGSPADYDYGAPLPVEGEEAFTEAPAALYGAPAAGGDLGPAAGDGGLLPTEVPALSSYEADREARRFRNGRNQRNRGGRAQTGRRNNNRSNNRRPKSRAQPRRQGRRNQFQG